MDDRICYFNGEYMRESEIKIPVWDMGFFTGQGAFEVSRTFNHIPFKWKEHIDRLFRSLSYIQVEPGLTPEEVYNITLKVFKRNEGYLAQNEDYWIIHRVSTGPLGFAPATRPTVLINCCDLHYEEMAKNYMKGIHLVVANTRQVPFQCLDPKAKLMARLPQRLARLEAQMVDPQALPVMLDLDGFCTEGSTFNIFMVWRGKLFTPKRHNILPGISRATVMELAKQLEIESAEEDLSSHDLFSADEMFTTATSFSICPVAKFNNRLLKRPIPGLITQKLISAWSKMVGIDIVEQCKSHLQA